MDEAYIDLTEEVDKHLKNSPDVSADQLPNTHVSGWEEGEAQGGGIHSVHSIIHSLFHSFIHSFYQSFMLFVSDF